VRDALDRLPLERALQLTIAALILFTVLSQGSVLAWLATAQKLKWAALCAFAALAVAYAVRNDGVRRLGFAQYAGAALIVLCLASTVWSPLPRLTFERACALGILFLGCGALAAGVDGIAAARRFTDAIVLGAAAVAVGGLLVLAFDHDRAVQPATSALAARYQGLGGGPNTAMMVFALALPIAALGLFEEASTRRRAVLSGVALLLLGSIVASGSRGALVGALGGLFALAVIAPAGARRRAAAGVAVILLLVVGAFLMRLPQPEPNAPPLPSAVEQPPAVFHGTRKPVAIPPPRLQDDVGRPPYGVGETTKKPRTLFGSSGRAQAWDGAIRLGTQRPVAGFGFGTEDRVFVDRYADFNSNVPENSYIGLFLQLGIVGALGFVAFVLVNVGVALMRVSTDRRRLVAALVGAVVAGLVLAAFQSYLYAVGNNATAAFWLCVFLLSALVPLRAPRLRVSLVAASLAVVVLLVAGVLERRHRAADQSRAMAAVVAEIGRLDAPQLDQYRYLSFDMQCLLYRRGRDPFALEACVDPDGRVIETIDRRTAPKPRIHSLRDDPTRSTTRVDRVEVTRLLREYGLPARSLP
jgi:O-antigen ligase